MFWTIVALVMTVVMGGIIAYNGDLIGRKYGKRRTSLFGLRPKHTAILITSITGVLISAVTTGVLFLVVPAVRDVIINGEEAIRMKTVLERDIAEKKREAQGLQSQLQAIDAQYRDSRLQLQASQTKLKDADTRLQGALAKTARAQAQARALTTHNRQLLASNAELKRRNEEIAKSNDELARQNSELSRQNVAIERVNGALKTTNAALQKNNLQLASTSRELQKFNDDYQRNNDALARQNHDLVRQNDTLLSVNSRLNGENAKLDGENHRLSSENAKLEADNKSIAAELIKNKYTDDNYQALRSGRIIVHGGEDLGRVIVPAGSSAAKVRALISQLLREASQYAVGRGAGVGESNRAVEIVDKRVTVLGLAGMPKPITVTAQERIDAVANELSFRTQPYCILAFAVANSVEQEPAQIDLQPLPDRLVYVKGQEVGLTRLDGTRPEDQVFEDVVTFLKDVGHGALQRGMIPRIDPMTGEPQVGSLGATDIVKVVGRIRRLGGRVRVRALAAQDIAAANPLELNFRIDPL